MPKKIETIDDYIAVAPKEAQAALKQLRKTIKAAAPEATEVISYQIPTFRLNGALVGFAAMKDHLTFHLMNTEVLTEHAADLKGYALNKGSIRFQANKPLPATLVKKLVKARIAQNEGRAAKKAAKKTQSNSAAVDEFIDNLDHPFKAEVQAVRKIIKGVNSNLTEEIKWAAPSFSYKGYLVTFNLWAKDRVHLVFHNGAILRDKAGLLEGDYPDRRMMYFANMKEVKAKKAALEDYVSQWVKLMDKKAK